MAPVQVKICGITRVEDAQACAREGAAAIGMVFYPHSPRAVRSDQAVEITAGLPPFVTVVGLFVDADTASVQQVLDDVPLDVLQFHGEESPEFCRQFKRPYLKAVRMREGVDLPAVGRRYADARGLLLDAWSDFAPGGTGQTFDWSLAAAGADVPLVLAGGLDAANVAAAVAAVKPAAIDLSSGVESAPGIKDEGKLAEFMAAVRVANGS